MHHFLQFDEILRIATAFAYLGTDVEKLKAQVSVASNMVRMSDHVSDAHGVLSELLKLGLHFLIFSLCKNVQIVLTVPIASPSAERSFCTMKHVKTYLWSTMTDQWPSDRHIFNRGLQQCLSLSLSLLAYYYYCGTVSRCILIKKWCHYVSELCRSKQLHRIKDVGANDSIQIIKEKNNKMCSNKRSISSWSKMQPITVEITVVHLTFQVSQGSAGTDLRWGENFNKFLFRNSLLNIQGGPIKTVHFWDTIFLQPLQI